MSTGVVIRLKNLQLDAGTIDIRHFFTGLRIPDGGVHIIGGNDGTAFILFSTDEDARRAMLLSDQSLCGAPIKLLLSSHAEMKNVIEESQRVYAEMSGLRPPEPPITNLSTRSSAAGYQPKPEHKGPPSHPGGNDVYLEIKEMPFDTTEKDVIYFFNGLNILAIRFIIDEKGRKTGTALIKFKTPIDKFEGLKKDRGYIGKRFVRLNSATERQWLAIGSQNGETFRPNNKRLSTNLSPHDGTPKRSRDFSPLRTDNCVELRGLPSSTAYQDVMGFFSRQTFVQNGLFLEMDGHTCKGRAFVEFKSYLDYREALQKDGDMLLGKQVRVISLSKPNMLDQIRIHKKYIQSKREEEYTREREKKKQKEDHQEHRKRKQREMDEWLRRQHMKEEEDRKRLDMEKRKLAQAIEEKKKQELKEQLEEKLRLEAREKARLEEERKLEQEKARLEELEKQFALKAELKKQIEQEERKKIMEETFPTKFSGAEEMDIEDNESSPVTSPIKTEVTGAKPFPFPPPMFGTSGRIIAPHPAPFSFNSHPATITPPFLTATMPPNLPASLPPILPQGLVLTTATQNLPPTQVNNLPPPLPPPVLPPPPMPPVMTPVKEEHHLPDQKASQIKSEKGKPSSQLTEFVRVSNSFFHVTEKDIRNFFSGLRIREHGVQFILKQGGVRTGYIFVHFVTHEEAKRATAKHSQNLSGRSLTVQMTTLFDMIELVKDKFKLNFFPLLPPGGDYFTAYIRERGLTCIRIGYLPGNSLTRDVVEAMRNPNCTEHNTTVLKSDEGGIAYVEFGSTLKCIEVTNRGPIPILGQLRGVTPLSSSEMIKAIEDHDRKTHTNHRKSPPPKPVPKANGCNHPPIHDKRPFPFHPPPHHPLDMPPGPRADRYSPVMLREPPPMDRSRPPPPFAPPIRTHPADLGPLPPTSSEVLLMFDAHHGLAPPFPPKHPVVFPEDLTRLPRDPMFRGLPPPRGPLPPLPGQRPGFPSRPPPPPINPHFITTLKMSNLSFKVTREDILEFFGFFDPLPDSVRLMYTQGGKLTGDGIVSFPTKGAANAAFNQMRSKHLLQRPIKLYMQ